MSQDDLAVTDSRNFIDGEWRDSPRTHQLHSPADGEPGSTVHYASVADAQTAVASSQRAWQSWRAVPAHERARLLEAIIAGMTERAGDLARQMTAETGKPINESRAEVARSLSTMQISAEEAKRIAGEVIAMDAVATGTAKIGFTMRVPVGVVAGITPFNAPLNTVCHKLGPALAAGNTLVLKPHLHGAGTAVLLAEIADKAGVPAGVFNVVHGGPEVGQAITTDPAVRFVNFTGSGRVAEQILKDIGLKRTLMELGGNAPTIVHRDAALSTAARLCADAAFGLTGQSCISTQRLLVHEDVFDAFTELLVTDAAARTAGDPWLESTRLGPMISTEAAARVQAWVDQAVAAGARKLCGGTRNSAYVDPTVLVDVQPEMQVMCDEVFGPVVSVVPYRDLETALALANDTPWGLKAGIFTDSLDVALRAATELEFGTVNINGASRSRVDQEPSGGVKQSGWGKEGPRYAIREMTDERMISMARLSD
jgi:acyl-CoA reductase-like NAD-dependent aldehyde dehydrogenase